MGLFEFIHKEREHFHEYLEQDALRERIWDCQPLLIIGADHEVVFSSAAEVSVTRHPNKTATLFVEKLNLRLEEARGRFYPHRHYETGLARRGVAWFGKNESGEPNQWYVNAAAEWYGRYHFLEGVGKVPNEPMHIPYVDEIDKPKEVEEPRFGIDQIHHLLDKHGLPRAKLTQSDFEGVVNEVWFAGEFVVRINKNQNYESDVWTETVAVPALTDQHIRTPDLVVFDSDMDIVPRLVTIYQRVPGIPLSQITDLPNPDEFFRDLGRAIRSFHDRVTVVDDPQNLLDPAWTIETNDLDMPPNWTFDTTEPYVLCHQDLHPDNILVEDGKLTAIIDWGDAGWANRSVDLRYIPAKFLSVTLEGYGPISELTRRNILIHILDQSRYATENQRSYGRYGDSTSQEVRSLIRT